MFININIRDNIKYNIIKQNIYNEDKINNKIRYRFLPIQYKNINLIVTPLNGLEGLFLEKNIDNIEIILEIEEKIKKIYLKKIICFYDDEYNPNEYYDCYYDTFINLLFIRIDDEIKLEYIILDSYDYLNYYLLEYNKINCKINLNDTNDFKNIENIENIENGFKPIVLDENYFWAKRFIIFPEIPFLISTMNSTDIINGSEVISNNDNKLIGILNYSISNNDDDNFDYFITPIFSILLSLNLIFNKKHILLNLDYRIQTIKNNLSSNDYVGLKINESYFNNYNTKDYDGNNIEINNKIFDKNMIISSIDDMLFDNNGMIVYYKPIPIKSYIWFFKKIDEDNYYNIKYSILKIANNKIEIEKKETKIYNNINIGINLSNFNYMNYKNKYIFELNENLLLLLKNYIIQDKLYSDLIGYIVKNRFKKNKQILGIELYSSSKLEEYNKNNIQIHINNEFIHIKPKIFIIKKYKNIQEIYKNYSTKIKLINFMKTIFTKYY
jgi:hypothetical protein